MPLDTFDLYAIAFFILFLGFFAGYAIGRRYGLRQGVEEGLRLAPLEMRRFTWLKGSCVVCGALAPTTASQNEERERAEQAEILGEHD